MQSFAKLLASIGGAELTDEEIAKRAQTRTETKVVKLKKTIPVELRYETMAVEDGKLHIYRDVYDRDTNVEENLESLLATYGVAMTDLSEEERKQVATAMSVAAPKSAGKAIAPTTASEKAEQRKANIARQQLTTQMKAQKEMVVEIAALEGKGYPAPVEMETGSAPSCPTRQRRRRRSRNHDSADYLFRNSRRCKMAQRMFQEPHPVIEVHSPATLKKIGEVAVNSPLEVALLSVARAKRFARGRRWN